jgi:hypothetical protein
MKFQIDHFYTHRRMMDCMIRIISTEEQTEEHSSLYVGWYLKTGMGLNAWEHVKISKSDFCDWSEVKGEGDGNV